MATTDITTEKYGKDAFALSGDERKWADLNDQEKVEWRHRGFRVALNLRAETMPVEKRRARFEELTKEFDRRNEPMLKLKAERDAKADKLTRSQLVEYDKKIRNANEGLYEIEMERAALARALGGKVIEVS